MRVPWTARRSNQSILKEINPECSLEGLIAEAEALVLWPPDMKSRLIGKDLDAWKDQGQEEKVVAEDEMVRYITNSVDMNLSKLQKIVEDRGTRHVAVYGVTKSWTQLSH